jgi:hypothetical protein
MKCKQAGILAVVTAALTWGGPAPAASHSDAPLIKQDPQANLTDVYAFIGTKFNDPKVTVLNVVVQVRPFCEPGDGVVYDRFADDALYSIHVTNPATGATAVRYDFRFSDVDPQGKPGIKNRDTILSYGRGTEIGPIQNVGDARQNFVQFYTIRRTQGQRSHVIARGKMTPPPNVGIKVTPLYNDAKGLAVSGATSFAALDKYTKQTVYALDSGEACWAGMRDDGFFADAPGIFDLLEARILGPDGAGQTGTGVDGFKGFNVLVYALQIPVDSLKKVEGFPRVGVYALVSRQRVTLRSATEGPRGEGRWIQVNRMGNPLFNEVLVALRDKDRYNRMSPPDDPAQFKKYALAPEIIVLLNTVFGTKFQTNNRTDLAGIYIPDVLRVDTSTPPVRLAGQMGFNRLSLFGGDTTKNAKGDSVPSGWPNGRRLGDDVADIAFTAIASGPTFAKINPLGDNINANDIPYNQVFPFAATPHSGARNSKDSGVNKTP